MNIYPLTDFEEYMFIDDRPSFPMDSFCRLVFSQRIDLTIFREAVIETERRHPFLRCRMIKQKFGSAWKEREISPEIVSVKSAADESIESGFSFIKTLDLNVSGIRYYIVDYEDPKPFSVLILQLHHTLCDGLGALGMIYDLLTLYSFRKGLIEKNPLLPLAPEALSQRGKYGWTVRRYFQCFFDTMFTTYQHLFRKPIPLFQAEPVSNDEIKNYPCCRITELDQKATQAYFQKAKNKGVTVNDLLIRDAFMTIKKWRSQNQCSANGWNRMMMPVNMRREWHQNIPIANIVSSVFIDRDQRDLDLDPKDLLKSIHKETEWIKKCDQAYVFLLGLRLFRSVPGLIRFLSRQNSCGSTCVMTNLGKGPDQFPLSRDENGHYCWGDLVLKSIDAFCPIRTQTQVAFCAFTYAGRLKLCLRYDHRQMTKEKADQFINIIREAIDRPD